MPRIGRRIKVDPYTWDRGKPTAEFGVMVANEHSRLFNPECLAVQFADAIHDAIETTEKE